jgi:signal transduction histidine kinase
VDAVLESGDRFEDDFRIEREDGEILWLAASGRVFRNDSGRPVRMAGVNYDITEQMDMTHELIETRNMLETRVRERTAELYEELERRRLYEAELKASTEKMIKEHERRRFLSRQLSGLIERERQTIGSALHDDVGQLHALIFQDIRKAQAEMRANLPENAELSLNEALERLESVEAVTRNITYQLRSDIVDRLGLAAALENLVGRAVEQSGIRIELFVKGLPDDLMADKKLALYRIAQESLTNVLKHARAGQVFITVTQRDRHVVLTVEDDGDGFDRDMHEGAVKNGQHHLGIVIMEERAVEVGGAFRFDSAPGKGTLVTAEVPLDA